MSGKLTAWVFCTAFSSPQHISKVSASLWTQPLSGYPVSVSSILWAVNKTQDTPPIWAVVPPRLGVGTPPFSGWESWSWIWRCWFSFLPLHTWSQIAAVQAGGHYLMKATQPHHSQNATLKCWDLLGYAQMMCPKNWTESVTNLCPAEIISHLNESDFLPVMQTKLSLWLHRVRMAHNNNITTTRYQIPHTSHLPTTSVLSGGQQYPTPIVSNVSRAPLTPPESSDQKSHFMVTSNPSHTFFASATARAAVHCCYLSAASRVP